eukprot:5622289-Pyramimonas_sp.AAC.1
MSREGVASAKVAKMVIVFNLCWSAARTRSSPFILLRTRSARSRRRGKSTCAQSLIAIATLLCQDVALEHLGIRGGL